METIQKVAESISNSRPFYFLMLLTLFLFMIVSLAQDAAKNTQLNLVAEYIELGCQIIFLVLFACRILKWKDEKYIWFILDFVSIIAGILGCLINDN